MKKSDVRTRFTQKALRESLLALMEKKSILNISVKEICAGAGVGHSTFYVYCRDQYDLLRQIENEVFAQGEELFRGHMDLIKTSQGDQESIHAVIEDLLRYIVKNSNSIQALLSENGDPNFQKRFFKTQIELLRISRNSSNKNTDEKFIRYSALFIVGGCIVLIQEWLKNNMDMSVQELAKLLTKLAHEGVDIGIV